MNTCINRLSGIAFAAIGASFLLSSGAQAAEISIGDKSFGTVESAISALGTETYISLNPEYTETGKARFNFSLPTKGVTLRYKAINENQPVARVRVIDQATGEELARFSGESRADAEIGLKAFLTDYFELEPDSLKLKVANTPDDPVAGNPVSLQTTMANATFAAGTSIGPSPVTGGARAAGTLPYNHLGISLQTGRYSGPGYSANITTLPLSYSIPLNDPRWALQLDAPLSFATVNGQSILSGSVGVGLRMPVFDNWTITPELRLGMTRNKSLGINATLLNASITSNYRQALRNGYSFVIGNSLTYSKSLKTSGVDYGIENMLNKNGIEFSGPTKFELYGLPTNWQFSVTHSKIYGNTTYIDEWVDVSASIGTIASKNGVTWDSVRIGLTYTRANRGIQGININFGYEF